MSESNIIRSKSLDDELEQCVDHCQDPIVRKRGRPRKVVVDSAVSDSALTKSEDLDD